MAKTNTHVNWFEIPVYDLDRAKKFYEDVFDTELTINEMGSIKMAWFPMVEGAYGATGTLIEADEYTPSHSGTLVYFSVEDIEGILSNVNKHGGKTLYSKMSIGEIRFCGTF